MGNFIETFKQGKAGKSFGLTTGIAPLDVAINGIQRKMTIGIAAAPKVGKTTLADYTCLISPFLHIEGLEKQRLGVDHIEYWVDTTIDDKPARVLYWTLDKESLFHNIEWIYFSGEIDRVSKEFKIAAFFMAYDYQQYNFVYKGVTYMMNGEYLMGKMLHNNGDDTTELIPVSEHHENLLKKVYLNRIIPIFGEYAADDTKLKHGRIFFIEDLENPTGLNKYLVHYAEQHGKFKKEIYYIKEDGKTVPRERLVSYQADNPDKFTIIMTDHIRKLKRERGFTLKENIDKWLEYSTILRNTCHFTFVHVCHSNRGVSNVERLRFAGEFIFPTGDDVKDSGNLSEECTILLTMFNPNDEKYNLERHFGVDLKDYPDYRSIHVVESRNGSVCPAHVQVNMLGGINMFTPLNGY